MKNSPVFKLALFLSIWMSYISASAVESGPEIALLKPSKIYSRDGDMGIYIEFNAGSLPGCKHDKGAYLMDSNEYFDEIHAQVLVLASVGGMRGQVNFINDGEEGLWSECKLMGLNLYP